MSIANLSRRRFLVTAAVVAALPFVAPTLVGTAMTGLSVANTSKHLQALRQAGLVTARKEGLRVYYVVAGDDVIALVSTLRAVAEHRVAEVEALGGMTRAVDSGWAKLKIEAAAAETVSSECFFASSANDCGALRAGRAARSERADTGQPG